MELGLELAPGETRRAEGTLKADTCGEQTLVWCLRADTTDETLRSWTAVAMQLTVLPSLYAQGTAGSICWIVGWSEVRVLQSGRPNGS